MKRLLFVVGLFAYGWANAQGVAFQYGNVEKAMKEAQRKDKMVFVDVYAVWCGPCKKAEKEVFMNDSLAAYFNEHFICVKIDAETEEGKRFTEQYNAKSLPSFVYLRPNGDLVLKESGYGSPGRLMEKTRYACGLKNIRSDREEMEDRYLTNSQDTAFLQTYMKFKEYNGEDYSEALGKYLLLSKSLGKGDRELFDDLFTYRKGLRLGGAAEEVFLRSESGWIAANPDFRKTNKYQSVMSDLSKNTYDYGTRIKNFEVVTRSLDFITRYSDKSFDRMKVVLDYYAAVKDGKMYKKLAAPYLDSIYRSADIPQIIEKDKKGLEGLAKRMDERVASGTIDSFGIKMSYIATRMRSGGNKLGYFLSTYGYQYLRFADTKKEISYIIPYLRTATEVASFNPLYLNNYADGLYKAGEKKKALELKRKAIEMDENLGKTVLIKNNLENMEKGKPLVWE